MCCFSRPVITVTDTNIFARAAKDGRQFLVYAMHLNAKDELAMILPIPVPKATKDDAVRFINLEKYPEFFAEMRLGFPVVLPPSRGPKPGNEPNAPTALKVVEVGSFVASFVPSVADFKRLDEQFRLSTEVWDKLPNYQGFGFAVFQLKKGEHKIHPMAFEFPRADPKQLFFPTVHIHDGTVKLRARFHHTLYCQNTAEEKLMQWTESMRPAGMFMTKIDAAQGIVDAEAHCYKKMMVGDFKNEDILV
jgi:hypothetical protein